ncbi:hypothetical protein M758_UG009700 [Ceratodon purpureus]|nr:hypothetical protein M758_UG009700 [Ceratodon purpureus]
MQTLSNSVASSRGMPLVTLSSIVSPVNSSSRPWLIAIFSITSKPNHSFGGGTESAAEECAPCLEVGVAHSFDLLGGDLLGDAVVEASRSLFPFAWSFRAFSANSFSKFWVGESTSITSSFALKQASRAGDVVIVTLDSVILVLKRSSVRGAPLLGWGGVCDCRRLERRRVAWAAAGVLLAGVSTAGRGMELRCRNSVQGSSRFATAVFGSMFRARRQGSVDEQWA